MKGYTQRGGMWSLLLWLASTLVAHAMEPPCPPTQLKVITHPGAGIDHLNQQQLQTIFSMNRTFWPNGQAIHVVVLPPKNAIHQQFTEQYLNMFPYQLSRIWYRLVYSGVSSAPIQLKNEHQVMQYVATNKGAIGYLCRNADMDLQEVQVVQIK